jgi:hypothetical protein
MHDVCSVRATSLIMQTISRVMQEVIVSIWIFVLINIYKLQVNLY